MRFDDTLETVLASDLGSPYGVQSAWRQLVDLIGRRRAAAGNRAMGVLRTIRESVPVPVRAASARALEHADPPPPLVRLFALDELQ
ncbi:MAG: sensor histidine kinase, partial [Bradyrhizobium sp.]|nr:sensor histidine kinase [Bradyrhizobium sp.]